MSPVEEFYKSKRNYEIVRQNTEHFSTHRINVTRSCKDNYQLKLSLTTEIFGHLDSKSQEEVYWIIKAYLEDERAEITKAILKRLKEKMENAQKQVLKDFKIINSTKE